MAAVEKAAKPARFTLSVDTWAVLLSLALIALIRLGLLKTVAW